MDTIHDLESAFLRSMARCNRAAFAAKGWTLRTAAPHLGVHWTHLHHVLKGDRKSNSLLARVAALPKRQLSHR
jgi:hypothetical protein